MDTRHGEDPIERPGERHTPRPHRTALFVALLALVVSSGLFAAAAPAGAAKAPGKPTAKAPAGTITTTKPTFKWSKATGAVKYELRAYRGTRQVLKKTGLTRLSWKTSKALPKNVALAWKVRASNAGGTGAWSRSLKFKIVTGSPAKAITAFSFQGLSPPVTGTVTEAAHTIALTVPFGTNVSALVATFATTGASVKVAGTLQTSGATANSFTSPVTYRVTAANASTQDYTVTVTVAANPAKAITAFSFASPAATGVINETLHTIALTVPVGTADTGRVATFATTGASITVGGASQTSGTTANDFTNPVTYTVTAADASTQNYTVTVYRIGKSYQGGKIAYIDGTGQHGLIAAAVDQSTTMAWSNITSTLVGTTGTAIGAGQANTTAIVNQGATSGAARTCYDLVLNGYGDWYLPSRDELNRLHLNRVAIGSFLSGDHWSSSEFTATSAWSQFFGGLSDGVLGPHSKSDTNRVRAVRSF